MQINWYLKRLSKMPPPEIPWRIWEFVKKKIDRNRNFNHSNKYCRPKDSIFALSKHFSPQLMDKCFPRDVQEQQSIAQSTLANHFILFGIDVVFEGLEQRINWHIDPITHKQWPKKFWGDIDIRDKNFGGIKFVWELNRFYFLFPLALTYKYTKDKIYADKLLCLVKEWLKDNAYPMGVNWTSGIEAGVRLANLVWSISFLGDYSFSDNDLKALNTFVNDHANHLQRYPSKFSSSNNHLLAEGFGLFIAGLYFPELPGATKWLEKGRQILEKEVTRQILPDGGSFEYSTTYLSFVFDFFLLFKITCDQNGIEYTEKINERLKKSCEFIKSIMDKQGNIPNIGDQDSAVLVNFGLSNLNNFSSILNTGSVLFSKKEFATGKPDIKTWILTGEIPHGLQTDPSMVHDDNVSMPPSEENNDQTNSLLHMHRHSGLVVIRDYVKKKEILFTGNATPLGMPPLYAHGHLDALSFTLSIDGMEVFVDPGTYLYHSGGKWRTYFRSTAAHNTLRINKMDMSEQTGDFMFGNPYQITHNQLEQEKDVIVWQSGHDAYLNQKPFARIIRKVIWSKEKKLYVFKDTIEQKEKIFVELFFHCHPECHLKTNYNRSISIKRDSIELNIITDMNFNTEISHGSLNPVSGWYSASFNRIEKSPTIRFFGTIAGNCAIKTIITII